MQLIIYLIKLLDTYFILYTNIKSDRTPPVKYSCEKCKSESDKPLDLITNLNKTRQRSSTTE